jgi:hypothetical protein
MQVVFSHIGLRVALRHAPEERFGAGEGFLQHVDVIERSRHDLDPVGGLGRQSRRIASDDAHRLVRLHKPAQDVLSDVPGRRGDDDHDCPVAVGSEGHKLYRTVYLN